MFDVFPLSPERTWATCCSLRRIGSALVHGDDRPDFFTGNERGPNPDDLARAILMRHALSSHTDPGDRHAIDLAPDLRRLLASPGPGGNPDGNLVRLRLDVRRHPAVDGVETDEVDPE